MPVRWSNLLLSDGDKRNETVGTARHGFLAPCLGGSSSHVNSSHCRPRDDTEKRNFHQLHVQMSAKFLNRSPLLWNGRCRSRLGSPVVNVHPVLRLYDGFRLGCSRSFNFLERFVEFLRCVVVPDLPDALSNQRFNPPNLESWDSFRAHLRFFMTLRLRCAHWKKATFMSRVGLWIVLLGPVLVWRLRFPLA